MTEQETNDLNIERTIIGRILKSPDLIHKISSYLDPKHFAVTQHRIIFSAVDEIVEDGSEPGYLLVLSKLDKTNRLEQAGGPEYLEELYREEYPQDDLKGLADILIKSFMVREANVIGYNLIKVSKSNQDGIESHLTQTVKELDDLLTGGGGSHTEHIQTILRDEWESIKDRLEEPGISGLSTGFEQLDVVTSGLNPTDLVIIAARPSVGKTTFAIRSLLNLSKQNIPTLLFSYEMSKKQLSQRMVSMESGIGLQDIRTGTVTNEDLEIIKKVYLDISSYPIYIDSNMAASLGYITSTIRRHVRSSGVKVVFIDYLQLMVQNQDNMTIELGRISRALKMLAMELGITVVALSQLNRGVESRESKRPQLSDLRQSGRIEEDADIVLMLYRPAIYGKMQNEQEFLLEVLVRKNRNGPIGSVPTYFESKSVNIHSSLEGLLSGK